MNASPAIFHFLRRLLTGFSDGSDRQRRWSHWSGQATPLIAAIVWMVLTPAPTQGATTESRATTEKQIAEFLAGPVQRWEVNIPPRGIASLENEPRTSIPCTVKVGTNLFLKVGIHLKGSAGSRRDVNDTPAMTLKFDRFNTNQTCFGIKKLYLNNSVQDGSRLVEYVCSDFYQRAGIPAPRVSHALVSINGKDQGLYVLKEGWDKQFLRRNFEDSSGNFYDGGFVQDIDQMLERDSGTGEDTHADLIGLTRAVRTRDPERRVAEISKRLEMDRFLTYTALQILTDDWDGYVRNRNNYRIYHNPSTDRFVFMPHGMDQMFENPASGLEPEMNGMLAARLFEVPSMRDKLNQRMAELMTNVFTLQVMTNRIAEAERRVLPTLAYDPQLAKSVRQQMAGFRRRVVTRYYDVSGTKAEPPKFDDKGVLKLVGWEPHSEKLSLKHWQNKSEDGINVLGLGASEGTTRGSWRTTVLLTQGAYRFEAKVRCKNLEPYQATNGSGGGLRISGARRTNMVKGTLGWRPISFDFDLDSSNEVQFIAEISANGGEVEFDADSLRIIRRN